MAQLIVALLQLPILSQDAVHGADRAGDCAKLVWYA
jgi:hypothetical protein